MSTIKPSYAAAGTAITCTAAALANAACRQSLVVDNTTNLFMDAYLSCIYTTAAGTIGNARLLLWGYSLIDNTPTYTDGCSGADAVFSGTPSTGTNMVLLGVLYAGVASSTYYWGSRLIANCFGGVLPQKWGVVVQNDSGVAIGATFTLEYQGLQEVVV